MLVNPNITCQLLEVLFYVLLSIVSILNGHVGTTSSDAGLLAPPSSSKLEHVLAMLACSAVRQLACLAHATPTTLGGGAHLSIDLVQEEVLEDVPHQWRSTPI